MQIAILTEGPGFTDECVLGLKVCSDKTPCPMHVRWWPIKQEIVKLLQSQTLDMLAAMVVSGKYQLTDLPEAALDGMGKQSSKAIPIPGTSRDVPTACRDCGAYKLCMSLWLKTGDSSLLERVVKRKQVFKRGEVLYATGQSTQHMYVIRGGSVKTSVSTEDGQVQVIGFHIAGELLGLNAIENRQQNYEARAMGLTSV